MARTERATAVLVSPTPGRPGSRASAASRTTRGRPGPRPGARRWKAGGRSRTAPGGQVGYAHPGAQAALAAGGGPSFELRLVRGLGLGNSSTRRALRAELRDRLSACAMPRTPSPYACNVEICFTALPPSMAPPFRRTLAPVGAGVGEAGQFQLAPTGSLLAGYHTSGPGRVRTCALRVISLETGAAQLSLALLPGTRDRGAGPRVRP
jgi:hypothetical protein